MKRFPGRLAAVATLTLAGALLAACATHPAPLQGEYLPGTPQQAAAGDRTGAMLRWGGRVIEVEAQASRTCFTVLSAQLGAPGRPQRGQDGRGGRLLRCRPAVYAPAALASTTRRCSPRPAKSPSPAASPATRPRASANTTTACRASTPTWSTCGPSAATPR